MAHLLSSPPCLLGTLHFSWYLGLCHSCVKQGRTVLSQAGGCTHSVPESSPELGGELGVGAIGDVAAAAATLVVRGLGGTLEGGQQGDARGMEMEQLWQLCQRHCLGDCMFGHGPQNRGL